MPTNNERRDVAERLRMLSGHREVDKDFVHDALGLYMGECVDGYDPVSVSKLADLIEPEERTCRIRLTDTIDTLGQRMYQCSSCGYLTEVEVCFSGDGVEIECFSFCPKCGARVVAKD